MYMMATMLMNSLSQVKTVSCLRSNLKGVHQFENRTYFSSNNVHLIKGSWEAILPCYGQKEL